MNSVLWFCSLLEKANLLINEASYQKASREMLLVFWLNENILLFFQFHVCNSFWHLWICEHTDITIQTVHRDRKFPFIINRFFSVQLVLINMYCFEICSPHNSIKIISHFLLQIFLSYRLLATKMMLISILDFIG